MKLECKECFDWFVTYSGATYCKRCTDHALKQLQAECERLHAERMAKMTATRLYYREQALARRTEKVEW